jgi:hypothetical protein
LKYYGDNKYEIEGFTTVDEATSEDTEYLIIPNSGNKTHIRISFLFYNLGGQPALNVYNANHIFQKIAKLFCLMSAYEENERLMHDPGNIKIEF